GSLYRPKNATGKRPGVLCPHGHLANGRFYDAGENKTREQIEKKAELFEEGGRSPLQARCVQLARMGCVVFHYDMIGYADSVQISFEVAHRFAKQRPEMNSVEGWSLFSPQAESHLQSVMGLQAYNSIRALDFLSELPDVDPDRLAVTGSSGGGTQTFVLSAIDPRLSVSFPAVMVSTAMQGGCTCENASGLRIDTGNVEFAGLFAPKPLGMSAADDWTKEMETKGFPELKQLFRLLGREDNVMLISRTEFKHNYNAVCRAAMYAWFNRHLALGAAEPVRERDFKRLTQEEMTVWNDEHPEPEGGASFERGLLRWWTEDANRQLRQLTPRDPPTLAEFRKVVGGAVETIVGRSLGGDRDVAFVETKKQDHGRFVQRLGLLRNAAHGEELPLLLLEAKQPPSRVVVWLDPAGKQGLMDGPGKPKRAVQRLLDGGATVIGVDLLYQGEFLADGETLKQTRRVENPREAAAYTFGYNRSLFARRTHDVLSVLSYARGSSASPNRVALVGLHGAGAWAAAARALAQNVVRKVALDTSGFRFGAVARIHDPDFLPGGAKYGDLPGMLALAAPGQMWLAGEGADAPQLVRDAYRAAGAADTLTTFSGDASEYADAAARWILGE
ncbi:MAG: acetylxylan esterase, partial [Pirellulaceae bacterium]